MIRLFPDPARDYPLWEDSTPSWDVGYTTTPETNGLSDELGDDLAAWQAFFEEHANPFAGWDSDANLQKWLSDGEAIAVRLQDEVQSFADVQREFGPWRTDGDLRNPCPQAGRSATHAAQSVIRHGEREREVDLWRSHIAPILFLDSD